MVDLGITAAGGVEVVVHIEEVAGEGEERVAGRGKGKEPGLPAAGGGIMVVAAVNPVESARSKISVSAAACDESRGREGQGDPCGDPCGE